MWVEVSMVIDNVCALFGFFLDWASNSFSFRLFLVVNYKVRKNML